MADFTTSRLKSCPEFNAISYIKSVTTLKLFSIWYVLTKGRQKVSCRKTKIFPFFIHNCKSNRKINLFLSFVLSSLGYNLGKNTIELIKHYTSAFYRHHSKLCSAVGFFSPSPWRAFFPITAVNILRTLDSNAKIKI